MGSRRRCFSWRVVVLLVSGLAGCSAAPAQSPDQGRRPDAGAPDGNVLADAKPAGTSWSFVGEGSGKESPAVALHLDSVQDGVATLQIVASGVAEVQGLAFRLQADPKQLVVTRTEAGPAWFGRKMDVIAKFLWQPVGELWGGVGYEGQFGFAAKAETVLATVQLKLTGAGPVKLAFRPGRNAVIDSTSARVKVEWLGGTFSRK